MGNGHEINLVAYISLIHFVSVQALNVLTFCFVYGRCMHYFCEKCALQHYKKSQKCFVCNAQTFGVFNPAKNIMARLKNEESESQGGAPEVDDSD